MQECPAGAVNTGLTAEETGSRLPLPKYSPVNGEVGGNRAGATAGLAWPSRCVNIANSSPAASQMFQDMSAERRRLF